MLTAECIILHDEFIGLNVSEGGHDLKQAEAEMRRKYEILSAKYKNQFVREVVSKTGTEEVSTCNSLAQHVPPETQFSGASPQRGFHGKC